MRQRLKATRAVALVVSALVVPAVPAGAIAAAPFSGLNGSTSSTTATTTTATTAAPVTLPSTSSGGLSTIAELGIAVVAIGVFATIIYVIRRDSHLHAPRHAAREIDRERGTVAPRTERIKRSRAKAKAARRARRTRR